MGVILSFHGPSYWVSHYLETIPQKVRLVLSLLNTSCLLHFSRRVIGAQFGTSAHRCFVAITASQFHLLFWGGRTIPNSLALPLGMHHVVRFEKDYYPDLLNSGVFCQRIAVLLGLSGILAPRTSAKASSETRKYLLCMSRAVVRLHLSSSLTSDVLAARLAPESFLSGIAFLTVAAVILRLEIIGMLAPAALWGLFIRRATFVQLLTYGASAGFTSLCGLRQRARKPRDCRETNSDFTVYVCWISTHGRDRYLLLATSVDTASLAGIGRYPLQRRRRQERRLGSTYTRPFIKTLRNFAGARKPYTD